jgi:prolyl 4-hydroxylase
MTGLTMESAERLQVQNYGIGGHYIPHWDHQIKRIPGYSVKKIHEGNRIATMLFYVSELLNSSTGFSILHPNLDV